MKLSSLSPRNLFNMVRMLFLTPLALLARRKRPNVWLITERPDQARDNGYCFFRYLREQHPEQEVYYIIDPRAADAEKVRRYGEIIHFDSWRHHYYYCLSRVHISAHVGGCVPRNHPFAKRMKERLGIHDIFLPHGVSYGVSEFCLAKYAKIDLFITSGKPEYDNVIANYGYKPEQVAYTGFPRLDEWHQIESKKQQILLMPTWRLYIAQNPEVKFEETEFYLKYNSLINNPQLARFLQDNRLRIIFYLHHEMRKYVNCFHAASNDIEIVYKDDTYDIQTLLKESALLITDYSSVHFDFAYMKKPIVYYQFDKKEFYSKQYRQSDFDAYRDGFGPVAFEEQELVDLLDLVYQQKFTQQKIFADRMQRFYQINDSHNCERVYGEIIKRWPNLK